MRSIVKTFCLLMVLAGSNATAGIVINPEVGTGSYNLVNNGGFETENLSSWARHEGLNSGDFIASNTLAYDGTYSAKTSIQADMPGAGTARRHDGVPLVTNDTYILSAYFYFDEFLTGDVRIDLFTDSPLFTDLFDISGTHSDFLSNNQDVWIFAYEEFTALTNSVRPRMVVDNGVSSGDILYIDNVAITPVTNFTSPTAVPLPDTLWMLGGGLGLLLTTTKARRMIPL